MEHTQLVARLLKEVATARTAVAAGYLRLWQSAERSRDAGGEDPGADTNPDLDRACDEPPSPDAG